MFCYLNNGFSMRSVEDDYIAQPGEAVFVDYATDEQLQVVFPDYLTLKSQQNNEVNNEAIKAQIAELEEKQHRSVREIIISNPSVLTNSNQEAVQRLQDTEVQIAILREQLK